MGPAFVPEMSAEMAEWSLQRPPMDDPMTIEDARPESPILGDQIQIASNPFREELHSRPVPDCQAIKHDQGSCINEAEEGKVDLSGEDPGDIPVYGEMSEIDEREDPPADAPAHLSDTFSYKSLSKLQVREHEKRPEGALRSAVRQTLLEMENPPQKHSPESVKADEAFLREIEEHVLDAEQFVAGSF